MVETNFSLVASVSFLTIFNLFRLLDKVDFHSGESIEYDRGISSQNFLYHFVDKWSMKIAKHFSSIGRFGLLFFVTELTIILFTLLTTFTVDIPSLTNPDSIYQRVQIVIYIGFMAIWLFFPALVIKEYKTIYKNNVLPVSFGFFSLLTLFQTFSLVVVFYFTGPDPDSLMWTTFLTIYVIIFSFYTSFKQYLFVNLLSDELEEARSRKQQFQRNNHFQ